MDRRSFMRAASHAMAAGLWVPKLARADDMAGALPAGAIHSSSLEALPGKRALIKRTWRPPNYETPLELFRQAYTPNDAFYVRWHGTVPDVTIADWRLRIGGPAVRTPREYTREDLRRKFKPAEVVAVNQCSSNRRGLFAPHVPGVQWGFGAMGNARWSGVALKDLLHDAGVTATALEVVANGADGLMLTGPDFSKSLPLWKALDPDTLLAFEMNGKPLPALNGFPARLVVPGWTGTYWLKAVTELTVVDKPFDGFWMKTAYRVPKGMFGASGFESQETPQNVPITSIKVNSLITSHATGAKLAAGRGATLAGIAWDGGSGIRTVQVSTDGGANWIDAKLDHDLGRYGWRQWHQGFKPETPGRLALMARAVAMDGSTQPEHLIVNPAGYHHNIVHRVECDVA